MKYARTILALFAVTLLFGCLGGGQTPTAAPTIAPSVEPIVSIAPTATSAPTATATPTATPTPQQNTIYINNYKYNPDKLTVKVGTTVTWINQDAAKHTVTGDPGITGLDSALLGQDETYSYTFTVKGLYPYHCSPHPYMKASVEVVE